MKLRNKHRTDKKIASPHGEAYTIIDTRKDLFAALLSQDVPQIEDILCDWLDETISYHDEIEQYYHGFLAGLLSGSRDTH